MNKHLGTLLALALLAPWARAQSPRIQIQCLDKLAARAAETVDINLDGPTLKLATRFLGQDPETQAVVQGLKGIYVKVFEFDKPSEYARADLDPIRAQLETAGWSRIVKVQGRKDGDVGVYTLVDPSGNTLALAILAAEAKEVSFVNIVGLIDLQRLGALEGKLGIPHITGGKGGARKEEK